MKRVVIFGMDGASYTVLDDLVRRGVMPYLGRFIASGTRSILSSTVPPLTPVAWTSLVTGRTPGHHGITDFFHHDGGNSILRVASTRQLCAETVWATVNRYGKRAGSLNFPVHNPAPHIDGFVIPGWVTWRWLKRDSYPPTLIDQLKKEIPGFDLKDLAMRFSEEKKAVAGSAVEFYDPWIQLHMRREQQWFQILRHKLITDPCELMGVVFDGVDKLQHLLWEFLDPQLEPAEPSPEFLRVRELCWDYFRQLDGFLEETVALVGPEAQVLIVSDHGFTATSEVLYINTWLEKEGYLVWKPETKVAAEESQELGEGFPYHLVAFDEANTRAFAATASSNGIRIGNGTGTSPLSRAEYESLRRELADALLTRCVNPETGERLVTRVWFREEIFAGPKMQQAPDLTLTLHDHGFFSIFRSDTILKRRPRPFGTHHPDGVFVISGAEIRSRQSQQPVKLVDVVPTVLYAMGLPISSELEGRVVEEAFAPDYLASHPPLVIDADNGLPIDEDEAEVDDHDAVDAEDDPQILSRLRALGYLD
jgi:predicted AlkP superfamily phosphohydrolase/phosphomutase